MLPSFLSSGWGHVSLLFGWVVLLGFFLLRMVLMFFFTCLVVLPSFPSSVPPLFCWVVLDSLGGVAIPLSFGVELPSFRSSGCWLRSPSLLLGGVSFLSLHWVAFLLPLFGWVVRLGVALPLFFFAWCCLPCPPLGWDCIFHLFCWVVLLSKIKKKRCKVKRNLKTVAKWKIEK